MLEKEVALPLPLTWLGPRITLLLRKLFLISLLSASYRMMFVNAARKIPEKLQHMVLIKLEIEIENLKSIAS